MNILTTFSNLKSASCYLICVYLQVYIATQRDILYLVINGDEIVLYSSMIVYRRGNQWSGESRMKFHKGKNAIINGEYYEYFDIHSTMKLNKNAQNADPPPFRPQFIFIMYSTDHVKEVVMKIFAFKKMIIPITAQIYLQMITRRSSN